MSYHSTDVAQPTASIGPMSAGASAPVQPRPETIIDHSVLRIRQISESMNGLRARLTENADRVFGTRPEVCGPDEGVGTSIRLDPALFDQLAYALDQLEEEHKRLTAAIERNCWAV